MLDGLLRTQKNKGIPAVGRGHGKSEIYRVQVLFRHFPLLVRSAVHPEKMAAWHLVPSPISEKDGLREKGFFSLAGRFPVPRACFALKAGFPLHGKFSGAGIFAGDFPRSWARHPGKWRSFCLPFPLPPSPSRSGGLPRLPLRA